MNKKNDVCYCKKCNHKKAGECVEISCICCKREDEIRLEHPIVSDESIQEEQEKSDDEKYWEGRQDAEMTDMGSMIGGL